MGPDRCNWAYRIPSAILTYGGTAEGEGGKGDKSNVSAVGARADNRASDMGHNSAYRKSYGSGLDYWRSDLGHAAEEQRGQGKTAKVADEESSLLGNDRETERE